MTSSHSNQVTRTVPDQTREILENLLPERRGRNSLVSPLALVALAAIVGSLPGVEVLPVLRHLHLDRRLFKDSMANVDSRVATHDGRKQHGKRCFFFETPGQRQHGTDKN